MVNNNPEQLRMEENNNAFFRHLHPWTESPRFSVDENKRHSLLPDRPLRLALAALFSISILSGLALDIHAQNIPFTAPSNPTPTIYASEDFSNYGINSFILVPSNINNSDLNSRIPSYRQSISTAMSNMQNWFRLSLNGHTFQIKTNESRVVRSLSSIDFSQDPNPLPMNYLYSREFERLFPNERGSVKVIWVLGTESRISLGVPLLDGRSGQAIFPQSVLQGLDGSQGQESQNNNLGIIAQELGHAFGIYADYGGFAASHSCTVLTQRNCQPNAPHPLPGVDEAYGSVMNAYGIFRFPNSGFNNSRHNPEIWRLYQSPFINPRRDPAPIIHN